MASPASAESHSVSIILPDATKKTFEVNRRRTIDEVKQIVLTRNYKIRGLRADYYLILNDVDVLFPEYRKFFDAHPALDGDLTKVTVRLVPKADVVEQVDGKKVYVPKPENKQVYLALTESAINRRKSVVMDEELERARLDAEAELRRRKRLSRDAKEEETMRLKLEAEEEKKRQMLNAKAEEDRKRRHTEKEKQEEQRQKKEAEDDATWQKLQEERKKGREEEKRKLQHHQTSATIDRTKLREALKAGPGSVHAESAASALDPLPSPSSLSRSVAINPVHSLTLSTPPTPGRSSNSGAQDRHIEQLEESLAKAERQSDKRAHKIEALTHTNSKLETDLEATKALVATLQLRLERTERDVERQRVVAENRAAANDREIASLKTIVTRYKAVRDCVAGELARINTTQTESVNVAETRLVLDRVRDRLDAAGSGHNWRSTKSDFTSVLFSVDDLRELLIKFPPKNPAAVQELASAEAEKAKQKAIPKMETPPPVINVSSFDTSVPNSPAHVDSTTSYETPRKAAQVPEVAEVEKIANLPIEYEIDYWQILPTFGDLLGEGGYAEVFKAEYHGKPAAVKKFKIDYQAMEDGNPSMDTDLIRKEIVILSKLNHPNVMKFYGASVIMPNICIVTELLVKGSLDVLIHDTPDFDMPFAWRVQRSIEVAQGLAYLHSANPVVIHRDIKSANVLLDEKFTAKLSDFGLAKLKRNTFEMPAPKNSGIPPKWNVVLNSSPVGTAAWAAPEILEHAPYNESSDIYSFGVFLWEFFTRQSPWSGHSPRSIIDLTLAGGRLEVPENMHPVLAEIVKATWNYDPWNRPTAADILGKMQALQKAL